MPRAAPIKSFIGARVRVHAARRDMAAAHAHIAGVKLSQNRGLFRGNLGRDLESLISGTPVMHARIIGKDLFSAETFLFVFFSRLPACLPHTHDSYC